MPTTRNRHCSQCDTQANPFPPATVGAYEGAGYYHCGLYRPQFDCRMRALGNPFCAVCQGVIRQVIGPHLPVAETIAVA
jgi:IgA Peptidase M64